jgi:hypothetical protein
MAIMIPEQMHNLGLFIATVRFSEVRIHVRQLHLENTFDAHRGNGHSDL